MLNQPQCRDTHHPPEGIWFRNPFGLGAQDRGIEQLGFVDIDGALANSASNGSASMLNPRTSTLEEMTFGDDQSLVSHGDSWVDFEPVFGGTRTRMSGKLKEVDEIRDDLFHFKREIKVEDHQTLANHRNWLLIKTRQAKVRTGLEAAS